ncbi:MAG: hypothetical protein NTX00_03685, partial [Candidatus Parcubacteria bacterium]|nr:hypothetical protein [Candidatus Parcubacteria bacterium]
MAEKIAQIIPLLRLKRNLNYFDYNIPQEFQNQVKIGQLVEIPFRNKLIKGVILDLVESSKFESEKLKSISKIIDPPFVLAPWQIKFIEILAEKYFVSAGVILKMFLPTISKRTEKNAEMNLVLVNKNFQFPKINQDKIPFYNATKPVLLRYYNFDNKIQAYLNLIKNVLNKNKQILIIFPFISEAKKFSQNLSEFENITCLFLNNLSPSHF